MQGEETKMMAIIAERSMIVCFFMIVFLMNDLG